MILLNRQFLHDFGHKTSNRMKTKSQAKLFKIKQGIFFGQIILWSCEDKSTGNLFC